MSETLELLNQLNWFLEPISNLVIFLFTTSKGYFVLLFVLLMVILFSTYNVFRERRLAYMAAQSYGSGRIPFFEKLFLIGRVLSKLFLRIVGNLPVFLMTFIFLLLVVGLSKGIGGMNEYVENQQKIKELKSIVKQLDQRYKVAEIEVLDYNSISNETQLKIRFFDYAKQGFVNQDQELTIKGKDIYFDAVVLNFEYSEIATGANTNLVLPYRIFSDEVPQEEGTPLRLTDENGIPFIFKRNENEVYAMKPERYNERIKEIMEYISDSNKARNAGIRSVYGNAVHKIVRKGETISIWVEQTGGLVIKQASQF